MLTRTTDLFTIENNRLLLEDYSKRFEVDEYFLDLGDVPPQLKLAADELSSLVLEGYSQRWKDCSTPPDIEAMRAAVRMIYTALAECESFIERTAKEQLDYFRRQAAKIENIGIQSR